MAPFGWTTRTSIRTLESMVGRDWKRSMRRPWILWMSVSYLIAPLSGFFQEGDRSLKDGLRALAFLMIGLMWCQEVGLFPWIPPFLSVPVSPVPYHHRVQKLGPLTKGWVFNHPLHPLAIAIRLSPPCPACRSLAHHLPILKVPGHLHSLKIRMETWYSHPSCWIVPHQATNDWRIQWLLVCFLLLFFSMVQYLILTHRWYVSRVRYLGQGPL